jgi:aryl-alcohol dehydrogenase-like predicted oxidoreductase
MIDHCQSPYHLDVLDVMMDLRNDGFVKSFSGLNFPPSLIQMAEACGFYLESNQVSLSLLNRKNMLQYAAFPSMSFVASEPLACGLLTDDFYSNSCSPRSSPFITFLSSRQSRYINALKDTCEERRPLERYLLKLMGVLRQIGWKHNVSISSVALRWTLQQKQLTVVSTRVGQVDRSQSYREVFTFELDREDLMKLETCKYDV